MSFGVRHSMLLVADIHVASFGADQLSLGTTEPPSSAMVAFTSWWTSSHCNAGSDSSVSESASEGVEHDENMPLSVSISERNAVSSVGRIMPSARR